MDALAMLIDWPVQHRPDGLWLRLPGQPPLPLTSAGEPIRAFNEGWRARSLFTLFDPIWVLALQHESGIAAVWYLTRDGALCAPPFESPEPERLVWTRRLKQVAFWLHALPDALIRLAVPDAVRAYAALPLVVRQDLDRLLETPITGTLPEPAIADALLAVEAPALSFAQSGRHVMLGNEGALVPLRAGGCHPSWGRAGRWRRCRRRSHRW